MPKKRTQDRIEDLEKIRSKVTEACKGSPAFRDSVPVFGEGPAPCSLMVVGEAPGRDETRLKKPFVGRAGKFLVSVLKEALGMEREEIYITNVVKVWPKIETLRLKTRKPSKEEEGFFKPYLVEEIGVVAPKVILAVGKTAFSALAPQEDFIPGKWVKGPEGRPIMPVYHPSYILRRQEDLEKNTEELKRALGDVKRKLSA